MPTFSDAMEIPPVIYRSDKAMIVRHCTEIQQKQWRYFHGGSQGEQTYSRVWAGALGSELLWGKPFCQHPGDAATFQHHSQACDCSPTVTLVALEKVLCMSVLCISIKSPQDILDGGEASSGIKWHSTSRRLNSILLLSSSVLETSSETSFSQKVEAKLFKTACSLVLDFFCVWKRRW